MLIVVRLTQGQSLQVMIFFRSHCKVINSFAAGYFSVFFYLLLQLALHVLEFRDHVVIAPAPNGVSAICYGITRVLHLAGGGGV